MPGVLAALALMLQPVAPIELDAEESAVHRQLTDESHVKWEDGVRIDIKETNTWPTAPGKGWLSETPAMLRRCRGKTDCEYTGFDPRRGFARRVRVRAKDAASLATARVMAESLVSFSSTPKYDLSEKESDLRLLNKTSLPAWIEPLRGEAVDRYVPSRATVHRVTGAAVVDCKVTASATFDDCKALTEFPLTFGFGEAAQRLARRYVIKSDAHGAAQAGARVTFRIDFPTPPLPKPPVYVY